MTLTDAEKTRLLAEGVMGWGWNTSTRTWMVVEDGESCHVEDEHWSPITNESHAAEVRERMRELRWLMTYRMMPTCDVIIFEHFRKNKQIVSVDVGCVPRGICHAALLALGLAKEEEL